MMSCILSRRRWSVPTALTVVTLLLLLGYSNSLRYTWSKNVEPPHSELDAYQDILNETLGFQKIFVINLPSRSDRRDSIALAAHYTGLHITFADGVTKIDEKALPPHPSGLALAPGALGSWRAHMNVVREIVERNLTSALILEDDSDWDLRIKEQMVAFAVGSRSLLRYGKSENWNLTDGLLANESAGFVSSPYGENWDIIWLGHCGTRFPRLKDPDVPPERSVFLDDVTVPEPQHINLQFGDGKLTEQYPAHTRVVHYAKETVCSICYGVSQDGAKKMLFDLGVNRISSPMDIMLNNMCEGTDGRKMRTCLTVQPQLFQQHRPVGPKYSQSDIADHRGPDNENPFTRHIRWSTQVNMPKLVDGNTDYIDSFPDGVEAADLGF